jgi:hypothetical protein
LNAQDLKNPAFLRTKMCYIFSARPEDKATLGSDLIVFASLAASSPTLNLN